MRARAAEIRLVVAILVDDHRVIGSRKRHRHPLIVWTLELNPAVVNLGAGVGRNIACLVVDRPSLDGSEGSSPFVYGIPKTCGPSG